MEMLVSYMEVWIDVEYTLPTQIHTQTVKSRQNINDERKPTARIPTTADTAPTSSATTVSHTSQVSQRWKIMTHTCPEKHSWREAVHNVWAEATHDVTDIMVTYEFWLYITEAWNVISHNWVFHWFNCSVWGKINPLLHTHLYIHTHTVLLQ